MTWTLLDHGGVALNAAGAGTGFTFPAGAAAAGDVLNIGVSSDTFVAAPVDNLGATWFDRRDNIGNQGVYVYEKIAVGGETSVTITTTGNAQTGILFFRLNGALSTTPADTATTAASEAGAFTASPSAATGTLGGVNNISIAYVCQGGLTAGVPTGITWSTGYTTSTFAQTTGGTTGSDQQILASIRSPVGTGSENPTATWTHAVQNVVTIVVTYVGAATVAAVPPVQVPRRRRGVAPRLARARSSQVTPAQAVAPSPAFSPTAVLRARRLRGLIPRRSKSAVPIAAVPVVAAKSSVRRMRNIPVRRGEVAEVFPQVAAPVNPAYPPSIQPRRFRGILQRRSRATQVVQAQTVPVAPAFIPQPVRARSRFLTRRRSTAAVPIAQQSPPAVQRRRARPWLPQLRARKATAQLVASPEVIPFFGRIKLRLARIVPGKVRQVPPPQVLPVAPAYPTQSPRERAHLYSIHPRSHTGSGWLVGTAPPPPPPHPVVTRPDIGEVTRPGDGTVARPNTGFVTRP